MTYRRWKIAQAPFAEAAFALLQRRNVALGEQGRARRRPFDPAVADRIIVRLNRAPGLKVLLRDDPELPSWPTVARWRREQPAFDRVLKAMIEGWRSKPRPVPEPLAQDVLGHIVDGGSFGSYSRRPGGPARNTLRRWMRDPEFAYRVAQACEWREEWYCDQIALLAEQATPGNLGELKRRVGHLKGQLGRLRRRPTKPLPPEGRDRRGG